jgi:hypothetical protein
LIRPEARFYNEKEEVWSMTLKMEKISIDPELKDKINKN